MKSPVTIQRNLGGIAIIKYKEIEILVSDDDYKELILYTWHVDKSGYVKGYVRNKNIPMHSYVMKFLCHNNSDKIIDHHNKIRHDNRKSNLYFVDHSTNCQNRTKKEGESSKYAGVFRVKNKYTASITKNGEKKYLGTYVSEGLAAEAYNKTAIELYGPRANINIIDKESYIEKEKESSEELPTGVRKSSSNRYSVMIRTGEKKLSLGTYDTKEEAGEIFKKAKLCGSNEEILKFKETIEKQKKDNISKKEAEIIQQLVEKTKLDIEKMLVIEKTKLDNQKILIEKTKLDNEKAKLDSMKNKLPTGVRYKNNKFYARAWINGKEEVHLGVYETKEEAGEIYIKVKSLKSKDEILKLVEQYKQNKNNANN